MRSFLALVLIVLGALSSAPAAGQNQRRDSAAQPEPLRVFIRSGPKSHGPGAHDYPRFLKEWLSLLNARGARATGREGFPTKAELDDTDVLVLHSQEAGNIQEPTERQTLLEFIARGGGIVVIHAGAVSRDPDWFKGIVGGSWRNGTTKWLEGPMHLYFTDRESAITKDVSNWAMDDEIYYDMDLQPDIRVLAAAYTPKPAGARNAGAQRRADELTGGGKRVSVYDIQPQMWTYERTATGGRAPYRAFVSIPGHLYENFNRVNYRAILLRGIAWAGKRANVDELLEAEELGDALRYAEGGPIHPAKAAAAIEVHPEFDLSLVAAEPLIRKAMNIDWDARRRLWVSETPEYPNGRRTPNTTAWKDSGSLQPHRLARDPEDSISILSDTNGDGVMDRKHVFADKLELVTGFVLHRNGVIAATAPDIWFLEDTNGDEVADKRTKLYTGLGTADTHAVINNLRWGLDGWIYATHGYSVGMVTSPDGKKEFGRDGSGVVRFKPDGTAFEQYSSRGGNTWGLDITWDGQVFWTQPTSGTVFFHTVLPEAVLAKARVPGTTSWKGMITGQKTYPLMTWPEQAYVQIDLVGQFTAAAGCAVYDGGAWPDRWRHAYFTGEPTLNIVHQQFVKPDGVSYTTQKETGREETEFMRSRDLWFRPIETRVGPDGALYVIDFYNQAVIHNDTRGPLHGPANAAIRPDRDHYFGRIWRVQHKQARKLEVPQLNPRDLPSLLQVIESSPNAHVKLTAWRLALENHGTDARLTKMRRPMGSTVLELYDRARAAATPAQRRALLDTFAGAGDNWTRSAIAAAATEATAAYVEDAFAHPRSAELVDFVAAVVPGSLPAEAGRLLTLAAGAGAQAGPLKAAVVRAVSEMNGTLVMDAPTSQAVRTLLDDPATTVAALPIVTKWDSTGTLKAAAETRSAALLTELRNSGTPADRRAELAASLITVPSQRAAVLSSIEPMLGDPHAPEPLKARLLAALGNSAGPDADAVMINLLARGGSAPLFDQVMKRPESSRALVAAIKAGRITPEQLGPANVARLRTHPNRQVAQQATTLLDTMRPRARERADVIAALIPEVEKPGNAERGKVLFTAACASCHKLGDIGKSSAGPPLNGMGAHGRAELLTAIVDPNREVDPSYWQWNVTTKKGESIVGVIASENAATLTLRSPAGDVEIRKEDIASRENTGRSLMPEGLDSLGAEAIRDILTFIAAGDQRFRIVDLRQVYTASSRRGFRREEEADDTVTLHRFGDVTVSGVPFFVMDPAKSAAGTNLVALKGGPGSGNAADEFPQRVEIPAGMVAASLHFLGGVGRWAWPVGGEAARGKPVMKVIVQFADGTSEEHVLKNGEHIADTDVRADVPLSTDAGDFTRRGQLRYFAINLGRKAALSKIVLESFDSDVVPATVAITASEEPAAALARAQSPAGGQAAQQAQPAEGGPKEGGKGDAPLPESKPIVWAPGKTKVLVIGGGSSHDFSRFFGGTDVATLEAAGFSVNYTEDREQAAAEIASADVAVISVNRQHFDTPGYRKAVADFAAAGKGLVMLHPGTWYAYPRWPELNAGIVGGGARGHDRIATFSVNAVKPDHPVMKGVPASFEVEDELYYFNAEAEKVPAGTAAIEVLAETSPSVRFKQPHPAVWVTQHAKARVVGITLGHDQRVHDHPAFKTLLANAVRWAASR